MKIKLKDVHNNIKGSFQNGIHDKPSIAGKNLTSTIDIFLQQYGEKLMNNKRSSIVALEPSTGEILCLVSALTLTLMNWLEEKEQLQKTI